MHGGYLTVCAWSGSQAVCRVCVPCVCVGGGMARVRPALTWLERRAHSDDAQPPPHEAWSSGLPPLTSRLRHDQTARSNRWVSPVSSCCLKKHPRGLCTGCPSAHPSIPYLPYQLPFFSPLMSPTGTDGTGQPILLPPSHLAPPRQAPTGLASPSCCSCRSWRRPGGTYGRCTSPLRYVPISALSDTTMHGTKRCRCGCCCTSPSCSCYSPSLQY